MLDWMRLKGFIDGNTVSVGSLMNGFKNLASELSDGLMPYLMDIVEIFNRLKDGDFSGAGEAVKVAFNRRWEAVKSFAGAAWDRVTGTVDVATGHNVGTLSGNNNSVDNMVSGIDDKVSKAAAFAVTHAAKRSLKACALYVNNALRAQGIRSSGNGVDVASNLLKSGQGFHQVAYSKDYVPQIGDVMSMKSNSKSGHNWGHVAIYTKKGWVSDFRQGEKYGNTGAASAQYWKEIQSGRIVPVIARRGGGGGAARSAIAVTGKEDWLSKINAKDTVSNADSRLTAVSQKYGIPQHMLYSVWAQESRKGNMKKSSAAGAKGHFQFMPGTAKAYGISGREWDFDASSDAAARYFQWLLKHYNGDHNKALAAYNWGNGNLDQAIKRYGNDWLSHAPKETQGYVNSINKMMAYKGKGGMMSRPLGGQAVAQNLSDQQGRINASRGAVNPHNVSNTQNTQITVNGGINVQTSASTVRGNVQDAMDGLNSRAGQYAFAQM